MSINQLSGVSTNRHPVALQEGAIRRGGDDHRRYVKATRKMTGKYKTERSSEAEGKGHNTKETKLYEATA